MNHRRGNVSGNARREHGFSLLECTVILILLGVMVAVAVSRIGPTGMELPSEAAVLRAHVRYAQTRAMADTVPWGLQVQSDRYTLLRNGAATGSLPGEDGPTRLLQGVTTSAGTGILNFTSWGEPCDSAGTVLAENYVITLSAGGSRSVTVTRNTGFVN